MAEVGGNPQEQRAAVVEMEKAAKALADMLEETEEMGRDERTLDHFERDIRELNQVNALCRADSIVEGGVGGWNKALADKVVTKVDEEEDGEELLSLVGGNESYEPVAPPPPDDDRSDPFDVTPLPRPPSRPRRYSDSYRVVGSLTPEMVNNIRRSSASSRPSLIRRPSSARPSIDGAVVRRSTLRSSLISSRRSSTASARQRDTSSTRVTGKVDYSELLQEQQDDLKERRQSMKEYYTMLSQVEDYQARMLESLDKQLVFMGIAPVQGGGAAAAPPLIPMPPPVPAAGV